MTAKKVKRALLTLLAAALMLAAATGCTKAGSQAPQAGNVPPVEPVATESQNPVQYYFLDGLLMGSYENGEWHSLSGDVGDTTYFAKDILAQEEYRLYGNGALLGVSRRLDLNGGTGLGGFETGKDMTGALAPYGELLPESDWVTFRLPAKLGPELNDLEIPNYGFRTAFSEDHLNQPPLATNSKADPFSAEMEAGVQVTEVCKQTLESLLAENGLANMEPSVTDSIRGDLDGDGKGELLIVATTPRDELGYLMVVGRSPEVKGGIGTYSVVLFEDDDASVQVVFSDLRPYVGEGVPYAHGVSKTDVKICQAVELVTVADMNGDGRFEVGVRQHFWESGRYLVFTIGADGKYKLVMQSDYGM